MMRVVPVLLMLTMSASACSSQSAADRSLSPPAGHPTTGVKLLNGTGPFEGGVDIPAGVYIAKGIYCSATTASTRTFSIDAPNADRTQLIEPSGAVRDVTRIAVHKGEFLTVVHGCRWQMEDPSGPRTPDPATLAGGCTILLKDGLVGQSVAWLLNPAHEPKARGDLQERLQSVVFSEALSRRPHTMALHDPAGSMIDFMDAPTYFVSGKTLDPKVGSAVATIKRACKNT